MVLIYTHSITSRISYIFEHVFLSILGVDVKMTNQVNEFIAYSGAKISYTNNKLGNEFFIQSHSLLFKQGIDHIDLKVTDWDTLPCFFQTGNQSILPFDIFAASFYLLTRYEECLPHIKDSHGRYSYKNSLAYNNNFLDKPIVDLWFKKFKELLWDVFPDLNFIDIKYKQLSVFDISELYAFRKKGFYRNLGGALLDLYKLNISRVINRYSILLNLKKDPYDIFENLIKIHKENKQVDIEFFVMVGDFGVYDKAISYQKKEYRDLLKSIADYFSVNLLVTYESSKKLSKVNIEKNRLADILKRDIDKVRFHFNNFQVPSSYRYLVDLGIETDYTMGYHNCFGFRAGTCKPYTYYDPVYELKLPIKVVPFCIHRYILYKQIEKIYYIDYYKSQVKSVGGIFATVISNSYLGSLKEDWENIYENIVSS